MANYEKQILRRDALKALVLSAGAVAVGRVPNALAFEEETAPERKYFNPIFPGANADPEVLWSRKTGRVYVYPTSAPDGFCVYSSDNLVDWRCDGLALDAKNIHWENKNFWAPSIIEKEVGNGEFKYYFYYCANEKIGVAVGDDPLGPFVDHGEIVGHELRPEHDPASGPHAGRLQRSQSGSAEGRSGFTGS